MSGKREIEQVRAGAEGRLQGRAQPEAAGVEGVVRAVSRRPTGGSTLASAADFRAYIAAESWWLDEYSLYRALRARLRRAPVARMARRAARSRAVGDGARARAPRRRDPVLSVRAVDCGAAMADGPAGHAEGIEILGDFPFMVTLDSADVWSRRQDFLLDASVGTPPDAFSETGQEWGLPPYNWDEARRNDFEWLRMRARRQVELYDGFRVDHLVGFYRTYVRPLDGRAPVLHACRRARADRARRSRDAHHDRHRRRRQRRRSRNRSGLRPRVDRAARPAGLQGAALGAGGSDAVSAVVGGDDRNARHRDAGGLVGVADAGRADTLRL